MDTHDLPRLCVLLNHATPLDGPSRLAGIVRRVVSERGLAADVSVHDTSIHELVPFAQARIARGEADAFVCTETAGRFLRARVSQPVALMRANGFDLMHALAEAARAHAKVAVLGRLLHPGLDALAGLLRIQLVQRQYGGTRDVDSLLDELAAQGVGVVIGSSMVIEHAQARGFAGVLATASHAASQALDDALALCRRAQADSRQKQRLDTMLAHIDEGIALLDPQGAVEAVNPVLQRLAGRDDESWVGRPLAELAPALAAPVEGADGTAQLRHVAGRALVVTTVPVLVQGAPSGTLMKVQDAEAVARADRHIRTARRSSRFLARYHLYQLLGESRAIRTVARLAGQYARTQATVLITGETGTGKEVLAQGIHNAGARAGGPFVAINCAALPEALLESELFGYEEGAFSGSRKGGKPGLIELAHLGTLFLDEIGDMPLSLQTRLLRVLQEQEVMRLGGTEPIPIQVRIIAATHRDLDARIAEGSFREDLYYRINVLRLRTPPLRERPEDLPELARHMTHDIARRLELTVDVRAAVATLTPLLAHHGWPGNVRELENVVERALVALAAAPPHTSPAEAWAHTLPELFGRLGPVPDLAPGAVETSSPPPRCARIWPMLPDSRPSGPWRPTPATRPPPREHWG
ncbi:sigma 54-interacting transcriptional regulator [Achromobacter sp. GG226]|nr:sigma 54-interacting transcriptional regulator [Verticiella sp. GG226]MBU4611698.1 sigma 54-interacting transcriptional regulator [Verticiella sp. GG226]